MATVRLGVGLVASAFGAVILVDRLGGWPATKPLVTKYWPFLLVLVASINVIRSISRPWRLIGPTLTAAVGVALLVDMGSFSRFILPVALLLAGSGLVLLGKEQPQHSELVRLYSFLRARTVALESSTVEVCRATAIAGDLTLDL